MKPVLKEIDSKCDMISAVTPVNSAGKADGVPFFSRFPMDGLMTWVWRSGGGGRGGGKNENDPRTRTSISGPSGHVLILVVLKLLSVVTQMVSRYF